MQHVSLQAQIYALHIRPQLSHRNSLKKHVKSALHCETCDVTLPTNTTIHSKHRFSKSVERRKRKLHPSERKLQTSHTIHFTNSLPPPPHLSKHQICDPNAKPKTWTHQPCTPATRQIHLTINNPPHVLVQLASTQHSQARSEGSEHIKVDQIEV
ncbi:hypothetical protein M758_4G030000 [Ceratodon purpureus]|nr:hypothetical protein M758_4G030000 [Ceratodon purpureus]